MFRSTILALLAGHKAALAAVTTLAQPALVGRVLERVAEAEPVGRLLWVLGAVVVAGGVLSGVQHYLVQRTAEGLAERGADIIGDADQDVAAQRLRQADDQDVDVLAGLGGEADGGQGGAGHGTVLSVAGTRLQECQS